MEKTDLKIRKALPSDKDRILEIIEDAKAFMRSYGNSSQWDQKDYPGNLVDGDLRNGYGYLIDRGNESICYFAFIVGRDPCYEHIEGEWVDDELPYGVIHRVASDGSEHGLMDVILDYCFNVIGNLRIDTHEVNAPMRHQVEKHGFTYCGTIYVSDGTPRRAYQKILK